MTLDVLLQDPAAVDGLTLDEATVALAELGAHQAQLGGLGLRLAARLAAQQASARGAGKLLTLAEVAERLGFTEQFVRGLTVRGELACIRTGKYVRVTEAAVEAWQRDAASGGPGGPSTQAGALGGGAPHRRRRRSRQASTVGRIIGAMGGFYWPDEKVLDAHAYTCGHCGHLVSSAKGWTEKGMVPPGAAVYVCPHCTLPSFFDWRAQRVVPRPLPGGQVQHLPPKVSAAYFEARAAIQAQASTAAVMMLRTLLLHVATERGFEKGTFQEAVHWLAAQGHIPQKSLEWLDRVRTAGNEVTHDLVISRPDDAAQMLAFVETILRIVYEFPGVLNPPDTEAR